MTVRIYLRVSSPDEAPIFENQRAALLVAADTLAPGIPPAIYEDFGKSGGDVDRPGLGKMLQACRAGDVVLFTSLSRMTRGGVGAALDILRQLDRIGCGWQFIEQPMLNYDSKMPKVVKDIMLSVFAAIDEDYRARISTKTKAALQLAKSQGRNVGGARVGAGRPRKSTVSPEANGGANTRNQRPVEIPPKPRDSALELTLASDHPTERCPSCRRKILRWRASDEVWVCYRCNHTYSPTVLP